MKLIVITGQMRSGTSMLAEVTHYLGYPVCVSMLAPSYPTYRPEWEEPSLVQHLAYHPEKLDFEEHLKIRLQIAKNQADYHRMDLPGLAIKSPLLLLHLEALDGAGEKLGLEVQWEMISRNQEDIEASMERSLHGADLENARQVNGVIRESMEPNWVYEEFLDDPYGSVLEYAHSIGVDDMDAVLRAVGRVRTKETV